MIKKRQNFLVRYLISFLFIIICIGIFLGIRNYILKKKYSILSAPTYIYKANELVKKAKQRYGSEVVIIKNRKKGLWERENKEIQFIPELIMGEGELLFGSETGDTNKIFDQLSAIIADKDGNIYVSDYADCRVKKFDMNGNFLVSFSRKGYGPGELTMPVKMAFDNHDNLCVLDYGIQIEKFSREGKYLNTIQLEIKGRGSRDHFVIDNSGNFYVSFWDRETDTVIHKFDSTGKHISSFGKAVEFTRPVEPFTKAIKSYNSKGPLAFINNELFYSQHNPYEIRSYDTDGKLKLIIFRDNDFMPPARAIPLKDGFETSIPSASVFLGKLNDKIINAVAIPAYLTKDNKPFMLLDVFDKEGHLLKTYAPLKYSIEYIDEQGKIYGAFADEEGFGKICRYRIEFVDGK